MSTLDLTRTLNQLPGLLDAIAAASTLAGANSAVPKYLTLAATLLRAGTTAYRELTALKDLVSTMVAQNRAPTDEEWQALALRSQIAHDAIQSYDIDNEGQ